MIAYLLVAALSCDSALAALFTPVSPRVGRYEVCATDEPVDAVVAASADVHYGAGELLEPLDAFGRAGSYNRATLTRLYGGRRVRVVHGWRERAGRFEAITLLSPHPDAALTRLIPGTMIVTWSVPLTGPLAR